MSVREVARRLLAWEAGQPLARYSTLHHAVVEPTDAMIVAFVRMAGESRPWGIAWGPPGSAPTIMSVPDGRVRDDVAAMAADFGEDLLAHFRVHNWTYDPLPKDAGADGLRQLWLPNGQHVAMLHQLAYAYSQTTFGGDDRETLNAVGRLAGWLFRESSRKGSQHLVDASAALREAFTFPAQDARQAHLGYLLAWLETEGDRDGRLGAATSAEANPVSPTMDPAVERDELERPLERRRELLREGRAADAEEAAIAEVLRDQLRHRWELCDRAYTQLSSDDRITNPGVSGLVLDSMEEFYYQVQSLELNIADPSRGPVFTPHPETDFHGSAAASRYLIHSAADERYTNCLIHDDDEIFQEALLDGKAARATVLAVEDRGTGRSTSPFWTVRTFTENPNTIREGSRVVPRGAAGHAASVEDVESDADGVTITLKWVVRKTKPIPIGPNLKPVDDGWVGNLVDLVTSDAADLTKRRSFRVWRAKDGPGAWLTHGKPPAPIEADIANDTPEVIVDDVTQIEGAS